MANQQPLNDTSAHNKSLLAADSETDSETRRLHTKTIGGVNYLVVYTSQPSRQTFTAAPVALTSTTSVTQILAADGTYGLDLCSLTIENSSATATEVVVYADNGTTEVWRGYVPAGDMRGIVFPAGRELTQGAVNKAWKAKTATSVASVYITPQYIKNTAWAT
jgi:hypothetical protein